MRSCAAFGEWEIFMTRHLTIVRLWIAIALALGACCLGAECSAHAQDSGRGVRLREASSAVNRVPVAKWFNSTRAHQAKQGGSRAVVVNKRGSVGVLPVPSQRDASSSVSNAESKAQEHAAGPSTSVLVKRAALRHGVPLRLLRRIAWVESRWNPLAHNPRTGAMGLMQLMPEVADRYGCKDRRDPEQSANAAARYLASLHRRLGS